MKSIFTVLQDIERLIYKILLWIILIPKTIIRIILDPRWAAQYLRSELNEGQSRFDEYVSPVILLLVVALLPSLGYSALPEFGVTLTSVAETAPTSDRFLSFEAQSDFISSSPEMIYFSEWEVLKKNASGEYTLEKSDVHPRADESFALERVDNNTVKDRFVYAFTPGEYRVYAYFKNVNPREGDGFVLETYKAYLIVTIPLDSDAQVTVSSAAIQGNNGTRESNFLDRVKEERTIFLALALMIPPLLFAFASQIIKIKMEDIGEETLKENFYVQCYYFSPLSLAIWGTYYAYYFFTADVYWYTEFYAALQLLLLPLIWGVLWFIRTEMKRIAWELDPNRMKSPDPIKLTSPAAEMPMSRNKRMTISFLIVTACILILGYGANVLLAFNFYVDGLRLFVIRAFPISAALLILGFVISWFRRRREKRESVLGWNIVGLAGFTVVFFLVMNQIGGSMNQIGGAGAEYVAPEQAPAEAATDAPTELPAAAATQTPMVVMMLTPTPMPTATLAALAATSTPEPPRFYVEEFNSLPPDWFNFMTYGDSQMIAQDVKLGKLSIGIRPLKDKLGWYYLINDAFTYQDVKIETVVSNQGSNANGVSLICRYSDVGWYEFYVSNSGLYHIYAVDYRGIVSQGYNLLADGGSIQIKSGLKTNVYSAICAGNTLSLYVNDVAVKTIVDKTFQFAEGKIGLAVSSPNKFPVHVDFESLTVSEP